MNIAVIVAALFGIFCIIGGIIGFAKAASWPSLITGVVCGVILLFCSVGIYQGNATGLIASLIIAVLLGGRFLGTWMKTRRVMPDLIMIVLSLLMMVASGWQFFKS